MIINFLYFFYKSAKGLRFFNFFWEEKMPSTSLISRDKYLGKDEHPGEERAEYRRSSSSTNVEDMVKKSIFRKKKWRSKKNPLEQPSKK
jgi:hypothetical protein